MSNKKPTSEASSMNIVIGVIIAVLVLVLAVTAFLVIKLIADTPSTDKTPETTDTTSPVDMNAVKAEINSLKASDFTETDKVTEYVKISVKDHGDIIVRLREDIAPITVKNFQDLVSKKFYDGVTIHRISKNFVIQGGDPDGDGRSDPSMTTIKGEFAQNGVRNDLQHLKGIISMARTTDPNSASSQFFICTADRRSSLDGKYAGFGYVVAGLDVVDSITTVAVNGERPVDDVVMEKVCFVSKK